VAPGPNKLAGGQLMYYFMGSKFQNELVYVPPTVDSRIPVFDREQPVVATVAPPVWFERVRASGATHVLALSPPWYELAWMGQSSVFETLGDNGVSWLFRVRT